MLISRDYIAYLERLPCNKHARRRQQKHGQWLSGWVPEQCKTSFAEPLQQAFIDKDCSEGVMKKLY